LDFKVWVLQVLGCQSLDFIGLGIPADGFTGMGISEFGFNGFGDSKGKI